MTLPARPDPEVVVVLRSWREALDAKDMGSMQALTAQWLQIEKRLDGDIAALAYRMAELQAQGKPITEQLIWREARFKYLRDQMDEQIARFNTAAASSIATGQGEFGTLGIQAANEAIATSFASISSTGPYWNRLNVGAIETMIGFAGDGSPLSRLLKNDYPDAVDGLLNALINGMARGLGPAEVARLMSEGMGMGLERALLIARTEQARAYRMASTAQYRASGVVTGFYRLVKKVTACMACLVLDGQEFALKSELTDHPRGACVAVPGVIGVGRPRWQTGPQWFKTLAPEQQIARMGPERYQLWRSGQASLADMAGMAHSDVWGDSPRATTLAELRGEK